MKNKAWRVLMSLCIVLVFVGTIGSSMAKIQASGLEYAGVHFKEIKKFIEEEYNPAIEKGEMPDWIIGIFGNERIILYIEKEDGSTLVMGLISKDGRITEIKEGEISNPTVKVFVKESTVRSIMHSDDPVTALQIALKYGEIRVEGIGMLNWIRYFTANIFGKIVAKFTPLPYDVKVGEEKEIEWHETKVKIFRNRIGQRIIKFPDKEEHLVIGKYGQILGKTTRELELLKSSKPQGATELSKGAGIYINTSQNEECKCEIRILKPLLVDLRSGASFPIEYDVKVSCPSGYEKWGKEKVKIESKIFGEFPKKARVKIDITQGSDGRQIISVDSLDFVIRDDIEECKIKSYAARLEIKIQYRQTYHKEYTKDDTRVCKAKLVQCEATEYITILPCTFLKKKIDEIRKNIDDKKAEKEELERELANIRNRNAKLQEELAKELQKLNQIKEEYNAKKQEVYEAEKRVNELKQEIRSLKWLIAKIDGPGYLLKAWNEYVNSGQTPEDKRRFVEKVLGEPPLDLNADFQLAEQIILREVTPLIALSLAELGNLVTLVLPGPKYETPTNIEQLIEPFYKAFKTGTKVKKIRDTVKRLDEALKNKEPAEQRRLIREIYENILIDNELELEDAEKELIEKRSELAEIEYKLKSQEDIVKTIEQRLLNQQDKKRVEELEKQIDELNDKIEKLTSELNKKLQLYQPNCQRVE